MNKLSCAFALLLAVAVSGCGNDSTGPAPDPVVMAIVSGNEQHALAGQAVSAPLVVSVKTLSGDPVANAKVNWAVESGGGSLSAKSSLTDESGQASVTWTIGQDNNQSVKAWTDVPGSQPIRFSAAPILQRVTIVSGDAQTGSFGAPLPAPLVVKVTTPSGDPVPNVKVNWGVVAGGGSVSAASSTTDASGVASIDWTLGSVVNEAAKAWTDAEGAESANFSATGEKASVLHFDGTSWTSVLHTNNLHVSVRALSGVSSTVFAVGGGCTIPLVRNSAGTWSNIDKCSGNVLSVPGVVAFAPNNAYAATGNWFGSKLLQPGWIWHYDGSTWTGVYTNSANGTVLPDLKAIGPRSTSDIIAVGAKGLIVRGDGTSWAQQTSGTSSDLLGVWGDPNSSAVFAVGAGGTILRYDGANWVAQTSGTTQTLYGVWASSATDVTAVGANGTILHYDGTAWTPATSGTTEDLRGIWGSSPSSIFIVGLNGTVLQHSGNAWVLQPRPLNAPLPLTGVWGTSPTDVYVASAQ